MFILNGRFYLLSTQALYRRRLTQYFDDHHYHNRTSRQTNALQKKKEINEYRVRSAGEITKEKSACFTLTRTLLNAEFERS